MLSWFKSWFTPKPNVGDFILTKKYKVRGKDKGGLMLRVEEIGGTSYKCSKGSFQVSNGKPKWRANGYVNISLSNIERILQIDSAQTILEQNIQKVKQ